MADIKRLLTSQISSGGEGAQRNKKRLSQKPTWSKGMTRFTGQYEIDNAVQSFQRDFAVFSDSLPTSTGKPLRFKSVSAKTAFPKFKTTPGRGGKQHGRPRFKITSTTPKKKKTAEKKSFSAARNPPKRRNSSNSAGCLHSSSTYPTGSGSAFLRHLDFRPIQFDDENMAGNTSRASGPQTASAVASGGVNYEGWMESNASASSSFTSIAGLDVSSVELDATDSKGNTRKRQAEPEPVPEDTACERSKREIGKSCVPPSQAGACDAPRESFYFHSGGETEVGVTHGLASMFHNSKVLGSGASHIAPVVGEKCKSSLTSAAVETAEARNRSKEDDLADRELRHMMHRCKNYIKTALSTPPTTQGGGRGGVASTRRATPHVSHAHKAQSAPSSGCSSNERNTTRVSSSQASSASASGTQSQAFVALDEVSRERVQQEFDLRLAKYISMLCGDNAGSSAFRRLQTRLLRQRQRASLSHVWSELASKFAQKSSCGNGHRNPGVDTASAGADNSPPKPGAPLAEESEQRNSSSNKKNDSSPGVYESLPPTSRRPHSTDLSNPARRLPTPSIRYLLRCAVSSPSTKSAGKKSPEQSHENSRPIGESPGVALGCQLNEKQCVYDKPPAGKDFRHTNRTAQSDGCCCDCLCGTVTPQAGSGAYLTKPPSPSPFPVKTRNLSDADLMQDVETRRISQTRTEVSSSNQGSPTTPRRKMSPKSDYRPAGRHSSIENLPDGNRSPPSGTSPLGSIRRTSLLRDEAGSPRTTACLVPNLHSFKGGDFIKEVSSRVEADLMKYNAVMIRCRALLGEIEPNELNEPNELALLGKNEPNKQGSSIWTHSSCVNSASKEAARARESLEGKLESTDAPKHPDGEKKTGVFHRDTDHSWRISSTDPMENWPGLKPSLTRIKSSQNDRFSLRNLERSCSALASKAESHNSSSLPLKRSVSNPHYAGVVDFGSVAAIKRLVDPPGDQGKPSGDQGKPKVTFDIKCDLSMQPCGNGSARSSKDNTTSKQGLSTQHAYTLHPKKVIPGRKKRALLKSSEKLSRRLNNLKNQKAMATEVMTDEADNQGQITPMRSRRPKATNESITSRLPLRMNPYYRPTLDFGKKRVQPAQAQLRPCSQTSWRTEDTDVTLRSPQAHTVTASLGGTPGKKKKKRVMRQTLEVLGDLTEGPTRKLSKMVKKKKKKTMKSVKTKSAGTNKESERWKSEILEAEPETCVQVVDNSEVLDALNAEDSQEIVTSVLPQISVDISAELDFDQRMSATNDSGVPKLHRLFSGTKRGQSEENQPDIDEQPQCSGERRTELASPPLRKPSASFKSSPKATSHKNQRSASSGAMKGSALNTFLAKQHPGAYSCTKSISNASGHTKTCSKSTVVKRYGYKPTRLPGELRILPACAEVEPKKSTEHETSLDLSCDEEASQSREELEKCRRAFATYKDQHPELAAAVELEVLPESNKTAVLRRAGPLVMALLIQWLVQYNYA